VGKKKKVKGSWICIAPIMRSSPLKHSGMDQFLRCNYRSQLPLPR